MGDAIRTVRHLIDRAADHQPQKTLFIDPESGLGINYGQLRERCLERSVIDTYLCCVGWRYKLHWFGYHLRQLARNGPGHLLERVRHTRKLRGPEPRATQVEARIRRQARKGYRAQAYPGNIALFRALSRYDPAYTMDEFLGWRDIT